MAKAQAVREPNALVRFYRETIGELKKVVWPTREEAFRLTAIVLGETIGELKKVVWPTREEAFRLTAIVLAVITVMALLLGFFDYVFTELIRFLVGLG